MVRRVFEPLQFVPNASVIEAFKTELKPYSTSKGTIQILHEQTAAGFTRQKTGKGTCLPERKQEAPLTPCIWHLFLTSDASF